MLFKSPHSRLKNQIPTKYLFANCAFAEPKHGKGGDDEKVGENN